MTKTWTYEDKLKVIAEKAKQDKKLKFTSLAHLVNALSLAQSYKKLNKASACGSDGITVREYGNNLAANIANLNTLIRTKKYKPKAVRRAYIPKNGKGDMRPLGLPSVEDKLVQMALKEILEAIFEADFLGPMRDWWRLVKAKLIGYYNYFGINGNIRCLRQYYAHVKSICFKWINRRSQKKSMNWKQYIQYLQWNPLPEPRIYHKILYTMPK